MHSHRCLLALVAVPLVFMLLVSGTRSEEKPRAVAFPAFRVQEVETKLGIGYAVLLADLNGDGKTDIIVVDTNRVYWYENPTWKRRTILEGKTEPDNVCIAASDIDGDGLLDLALGAGWTKANGTLQWLKRGKTLEEPWTLYPIGSEPSIHRIRFADLAGDGKAQLIVAPLNGRDGRGVRLLAYKLPKNPLEGPWVPEVLDDSLHAVHNFWPIPAASGKGMDVLTASKEGVSRFSLAAPGSWTRQRLADKSGSGEIKLGKLKSGRRYIATIEPMHGDQVVVYSEPADPKLMWDRQVIDKQLRWGHAVWCADLDGDGDDELIIGVRDNLSDKPGERRGVRIYKCTDGKGTQWVRHMLEDGGVAVEDMAAADLNGDGKIHIVAVGRQTHNLRIYWNEGQK